MNFSSQYSYALDLHKQRLAQAERDYRIRCLAKQHASKPVRSINQAFGFFRLRRSY